MNQFLTLKKLKNIFIENLSTLYEEKESISIFYSLLNARNNISKIDFLLNPDLQIDSKMMLIDLNHLKNGKPIQYIIGETLFMNLPFEVTNSVLIPRPETEELVDMIIKKHQNRSSLSILDIGTGSGAIAISLAHFFPSAAVLATDFSETALQICYNNALKNGVNIQILKHDILLDTFDVFTADFDIIVSNPPYIPQKQIEKMHQNVVHFEPHSALFVPDHDPIIFYKKISDLAKQKLKKGGSLYFETHEDFHNETIKYLEECELRNVKSLKDINGKNRFILAEK